ncbi:MAG: flagellin [Candidatus Muiribacteriota bacterium]
MSNFGVINNNVSAINAYRTLGKTNRGLNKNLERLSSGLRINRAADDAAGLAVSEKMRGQIGGLDQAVRNAEDGISMIQTAEGVMDTTHSILQRMRTLSVQASNDNYTTYDRQRLQKEVDELVGQIDRISEYTEFNTKNLLDGSATGRANSLDSKVLTAEVSDVVASADYSITVVNAGGASRVHGSTAWRDTNGDAMIDLRDLGLSGDVELQIEIDGNARAVELNEEDNINDVVRKINGSNLGVLAGTHAVEVNGETHEYLTMTSRRTGSKHNISFGDDPDGTAIALGLFGGVDDSVDSNDAAVPNADDATDAGIKRFVTGTDTVISITNITDQRLFPTIPPGMADESVVNQDIQGNRVLGRFVSNSGIFGEQELSTVFQADNESVDKDATEALRDSALLKGLTLNIDQDFSYGYADIGEDYFNHNGDAISMINHTGAAIPTGNLHGFTRGGEDFDAEALDALNDEQQISIMSTRLSVRDTRQVYQIGANEGQTLTVDYANISAESLGLTSELRGTGNIFDAVDELDNGTKTQRLSLNVSIETQKSASAAITTINDALNTVSEARSKLGAFQNSLEKSVDYLNIAHENQVASESRIRDVDMAKEMSDFTRNQILTQSGTAMLAQANQKPQNVLSLIG